MIHSCQLTHSKKKKKDTKVATNEKRDSILVNRIWGSVLTMKKIVCHLNRIEKHYDNCAGVYDITEEEIVLYEFI